MIPGDERDADWERVDPGHATSEERWQALLHTAEMLRQHDHRDLGVRRRRLLLPGRTGRCVIAAVAAGAGLATWHVLATPARPVAADAGADSYMFSLANQDRASNGVGALQWGSTLGSIGEGRPYGGCGFNVNGRSVDMIQRSYFAHQILNCGGQYVFSMINANGVGYRSAGENIGWSSNAGGAGGSANYVNNAFMNSPDHRSNILNPNYTHLGVGSASSGSWQGNSNVWMFTQVFIQANGSPAPPPPPPPAPRPRPPAPPSTPPVRNDPQPTPDLPAVTPPPTPPPTPTPTPEPTQEPGVAAPIPPANQPPLLWVSRGLLTDSIESVLEGILLD